MQPKRKPKWYDSEGQRGTRRVVLQQSNSYRTLISLVLLLGLVLLLLQQFSDTKKVAQIGQAIGLFAKDELTDDGNSDVNQSLGNLSEISEESRKVFESLQLRSTGDAAYREQSIWYYYLSRLTTEQQDLLFRFFLAPKSKVAKEEVDPLMEQCSAELKQWCGRYQANDSTEEPSSIDVDDIDLLKNMHERLDAWRSIVDSTRDVGSPFRIALDRALLKRFLDNQNWMSKEQVVALRSWARIRELRNALDQGTITAEQVPIIELSQIMGGENASFRGVPIRFSGTIASADERTGRLQSEEWNGVAYRVWWMKPSEISSQPVAVYVPIELEPSQFEAYQKSELEILGFFAKRKAYASQRGPEVAPVLFAAAVRKSDGPSAVKQGPFSRWLSSNAKQSLWMPPTDLATPLRLIKTTLESIPKFSVNQSGQTPIPLAALSLLLVAQKHGPELVTLTSDNHSWDLLEQYKLGKFKGWCNKLKVWSLDSIQSSEDNKELISTFGREGLTTIYELSVQLSSNTSNNQQSVYVSAIPEAWRLMLNGDSVEIYQPIEVIGFQRQSDTEESSYIVGSHIAWKLQPDESGANTKFQPEVTDIERYLLQRGWDLSQRDVAQQLQTPAQPLSRQEEGGLFSLLRIANEDRLKLREDTLFKPTSIVQIIKSSLSASSKSKQRPSLLWTECDARVVRVTRINIESPSQQNVLGKDHYYQLDCFADIGNVTFEIPTETESITYAGEYPITCVALEIPEWLYALPPLEEPSSDVTGTSTASDGGPEKNQVVFYPRLNGKISGWFYRFWSYRTQEMTQRLGIKHRQITPLIVMSDFQVGSSQEKLPSDGSVSSIAWIAGLVMVGAVWWTVRSYGKNRDNRSKKPIRFSVKRESDSN